MDLVPLACGEVKIHVYVFIIYIFNKICRHYYGNESLLHPPVSNPTRTMQDDF